MQSTWWKVLPMQSTRCSRFSVGFLHSSLVRLRSRCSHHQNLRQGCKMLRITHTPKWVITPYPLMLTCCKYFLSLDFLKNACLSKSAAVGLLAGSFCKHSVIILRNVFPKNRGIYSFLKFSIAHKWCFGWKVSNKGKFCQIFIYLPKFFKIVIFC